METPRPASATAPSIWYAAVVPINADALEDWILANSPEFVDGMRLADEELKRGDVAWLDDRGRVVKSKPRRAARRAVSKR